MKRHKSTVLAVLLVLFLMDATAQAQSVVTLPQDQLQKTADLLRDLQARRQYTAIVSQYQTAANGAWWTNTALVQQLGLTDDQKAKIEKAYESHRQNLVSSTYWLGYEEGALAHLLDSESIDRNAVYTQIDRVVHARSEMERENSTMTLEMRETLTRAQWVQLQAAPQWSTSKKSNFLDGSPGTILGQRGTAPASAPSGPGQRRGPGQQ